MKLCAGKATMASTAAERAVVGVLILCERTTNTPFARKIENLKLGSESQATRAVWLCGYGVYRYH